MICTKKAHPCIIFQTFEYSNESSPNFSCHFWTHKVRVYLILHHCSVLWKTTPLYLLSSNLIYFGQIYPIDVKFSDFWVVGWKFTKFLMSYLKPQVIFSLNFVSVVNVMKHNLSVFFHLNLYMLWTKGSNQSANSQTFYYSHEN